MPQRKTLRGLGATAIVGAALVAAGCGAANVDTDNADVEAGKQLFVQSCGACHTLQDAGTQSAIGPNLDDAFRASRQAGFKESQFAGVTKKWIEIAQEPMPRDLVTGQDADDVSAYVARVAGTDENSAVREAPDVDLPPRYGEPGGDDRGAPFAGPEGGADGPRLPEGEAPVDEGEADSDVE